MTEEEVKVNALKNLKEKTLWFHFLGVSLVTFGYIMLMCSLYINSFPHHDNIYVMSLILGTGYIITRQIQMLDAQKLFGNKEKE